MPCKTCEAHRVQVAAAIAKADNANAEPADYRAVRRAVRDYNLHFDQVHRDQWRAHETYQMQLGVTA